MFRLTPIKFRAFTLFLFHFDSLKLAFLHFLKYICFQCILTLSILLTLALRQSIVLQKDHTQYVQPPT